MGGSMIGRRNPKNEPAILKGTEIRNQISRVANIVVIGTAPEERAAIRKKFKKTNVPKMILLSDEQIHGLPRDKERC